ADKGLPAAMLRLGDLYRDGQNLPEDLSKSVSYYERALATGEPMAAYKLGETYLKGGVGLDRDVAKAVSYLETARSGGVVRASILLGDIFRDGTGGERDDERAIAYYKEAFDTGDQSAAYRLASLYATRGEAVQTLQYYDWLVKQGDPLAQLRLGDL